MLWQSYSFQEVTTQGVQDWMRYDRVRYARRGVLLYLAKRVHDLTETKP